MQSYAYGFPRIGKNREYKKIIEDFWAGRSTEAQTREEIDDLQGKMLSIYKEYADLYPVGEMTFYDNLLDTAIMTGLYGPKNLNEYYALCRGHGALEMTKWFNTNYHYLVPNFEQLKAFSFKSHWNKPKEYWRKFQNGIPYFVGPFTFLKLSKGTPKEKFFDYLEKLTAVYKELIQDMHQVHFDEPAFVMELTSEEIRAIKRAYKEIGSDFASHRRRIHLFTYYDSVDFLKDLYDLPVESIALDFVHGKKNLTMIKKYGFPSGKTLIAGLVDGRNVWRSNINQCLEVLAELSKETRSLVVSNAGPLYHLPITTSNEKFDERLKSSLSFAIERLKELQTIAKDFGNKKQRKEKNVFWFDANQQVQERIKAIQEKDFIKEVPYSIRSKWHKKILGLPLFPTTTIGSFPQSLDVRTQRKYFRTGQISREQYKSFIQEKISEVIKYQEELGLDVLVHGEFERTDMVEFFAEKLEGMATTQNGWIISYGTRVYRPPIIFADIVRPEPMTLEEIRYAQSLTQKPLKGMLTGAVTIIAWSFVREDIPLAQVAYQLALALRDEIRDYEQAGIKIVQIDEPALREKAPIKKSDWPQYFDWAIKSFRLTTNTDPQTQIHTHMCYSEFGEIIQYIKEMDFDVISIEATRSGGDIIEQFEQIQFDRQIGLGVWDIHSPEIPALKGMKGIIQRALRFIPRENFWINPDCGLKTRQWKETSDSLKNLTVLAKDLRKNKGINRRGRK